MKKLIPSQEQLTPGIPNSPSPQQVNTTKDISPPNSQHFLIPMGY